MLYIVLNSANKLICYKIYEEKERFNITNAVIVERPVNRDYSFSIQPIDGESSPKVFAAESSTEMRQWVDVLIKNGAILIKQSSMDVRDSGNQAKYLDYIILIVINFLKGKLGLRRKLAFEIYRVFFCSYFGKDFPSIR